MAGGALRVYLVVSVAVAGSVCNEPNEACDATIVNGAATEHVQEEAVNLVQASVVLREKLTGVTSLDAGCACSPVTFQYHVVQGMSHAVQVQDESGSPALQDGDPEKGAGEATVDDVGSTELLEFYAGATAANRYYLESCNYEPDWDCKSSPAQAIFYKSKLERRSSAPHEEFDALLDRVISGQGAGCSCDAASIAMHRIWSTTAPSSLAYLDYCGNTTNPLCPCDPLEAEFHFLGSKAHEALTQDTAFTAAGHKAYAELCPYTSTEDEIMRARQTILATVYENAAALWWP